MKSSMYAMSMKAAFVSLFVIFISAQVFAQTTGAEKTIRGIVKSMEDNTAVPGTNIYLKSSSSVGTFSDSNGQFEFPRALRAGDVLVFSFLGLKTTEYVVPVESVGSIAILMPYDPIQMVDEILVEGKESDRAATCVKRVRKVKGSR
jgi:hypothetical protein